jgi:hypothetical protein
MTHDQFGFKRRSSMESGKEAERAQLEAHYDRVADSIDEPIRDILEAFGRAEEIRFSVTGARSPLHAEWKLDPHKKTRVMGNLGPVALHDVSVVLGSGTRGYGLTVHGGAFYSWENFQQLLKVLSAATGLSVSRYDRGK